MGKAISIQLTTEERTKLESTLCSATAPVRDVLRSRIVLLAAEGNSNQEIAVQLGVHRHSVALWRQRFARQRLKGLEEKPRRGRKRLYEADAVEKIIDTKSFFKFLQLIDRRTPAELDLHLIVDNYATHKHGKGKEWLVKHPRFHFHFIPTLSSWLNAVERFFAELTEKRLRRGIFRSVLDLIEAIDAYLEERNQDPKPFLWSKTAEEILDKLAPVYANNV
jgi:transposase